MDLNTAIKNIVRDYIKNEKMTDIVYATYTGSGLKIDGKPIVIPLDMVNIPQELTNYKVKAIINGTEQEITIKNELVSGDCVAVVQKQGGQKYAVIGRLK